MKMINSKKNDEFERKWPEQSITPKMVKENREKRSKHGHSWIRSLKTDENCQNCDKWMKIGNLKN